jgi:hypothetical protein
MTALYGNVSVEHLTGISAPACCALVVEPATSSRSH